MKVEIGRTKLVVPHLDREIVFIHPAKEGNIFNLDEKLSEDGLAKPVMSQQVSLCYDAYVNEQENDSRKMAEDVRNFFREGIGYVWTGVLWTKQGMYGRDCSSVNEIREMSEKDLQEKLNGETLERVVFSKDGRVRFTPYDNIKYGEQTSRELARNGGVIVLTGSLEQAEKAAKTSEKFDYGPWFDGEKVKEPVQRFAALVSCWYGYGLGVYADCHGDDRLGFAFGVDESGEATRARK